MSDALLSVENLSVRYASVQALFDVSIEVPQGSVVAVLGANGAGKSTLARTVSGLVPAFEGTVTFGGRRHHEVAPAPDPPRGPRAHPGGTGDLSRAVRTGKPADGGPQGREHRSTQVRDGTRVRDVPACSPIAEASAPAHCRVASNRCSHSPRALAVPPRLIIADEMSLGLAPLVVDFVFESIERASKSGVTIVLIEQFIHRALALASECVILRQGSVAWTGPADQARQEVLDRYLGEAADAMS